MYGNETSYVVRTADVTESILAQMDPDGDYIEHAFNLANARQWAERQGHKYSQRVWNAARGAWDYVYTQSGAKARHNMNAASNWLNRGIGSSKAKAKVIAKYNENQRSYNKSLLGKAERALRRVKGAVRNGMRRATNFASNVGKEAHRLYSTKIRKDGRNAFANPKPNMLNANMSYHGQVPVPGELGKFQTLNTNPFKDVNGLMATEKRKKNKN